MRDIDDCIPAGAFLEAAAMQALEAGQIPMMDLLAATDAYWNSLLDEIHRRDQKIADLERCLKLATDMVVCMQDVRGAGK